MSEHEIRIRSFGVVFDLERRIHRIDRFRVPLPYGLPLKSIAYAAIGLLAVLIAQKLPIVGSVLAGLPTPARYVLVPIGISYVLTRYRVDGRSAHTAAAAWVRFRIRSRSVVAFRPARTDRQVRFGDICFVARLPQRSRRRREAAIHEPE